MGGGGWLLTSLFSIIYILGLVCYKHTIHIYIYTLYIVSVPELFGLPLIVRIFQFFICTVCTDGPDKKGCRLAHGSTTCVLSCGVSGQSFQNLFQVVCCNSHGT